MVRDNTGNTKLLHVTKSKNIKSIMKHGLRPSGLGVIYLSPLNMKKEIKSRLKKDETLLLVETEQRPLTYFKDSEEWERLCWCKKPIPSKNIEILILP